MTLDEAIKHCEEVAKHEEWMYISELQTTVKCTGEHGKCATDHRQLAEWLTELKQWRRVYGVCPSYEMCIPECREGYDAQIVEYKRLLKAAVEDFAKLDRENAWNKNCMMPEMDCADCPLSWDSVDDSVEPCHNWRYADEALALLGKDTNVPASKDDANVGHKSGSWISCEDRLPKENILVLCYARSTTGEGNSCFLGAIVHGEFWFLQVNDIGHVSFPVLHWEVTHWQPLPKSPKDGET